MINYIFYATAILGALLWWKKSRTKTKESFLISGIPNGTVVLHQYGPAPYVPSISPFVMKLETYLRVAKIPYVNKYDRKPGPKGKIPWIQYNDDVIPDSQTVVEFLNREFKVDLNAKLTNEQKAVGHVVRRTAEEWLYWVLVMFRVVLESNGTVYRLLGLPSIIIWYMRRAAKPRLVSQGIGRHSRQEVTSMMNDDLAAINTILGDKKYLFGETSDDVTEFDCALFGQLCQLSWQMPGCGVEELIQDKYPRLVCYCQRMKEEFWPDWEERLKKISLETSDNTKTAAPSSSLLSSSTGSSSPAVVSNSSSLSLNSPSSSPATSSLSSPSSNGNNSKSVLCNGTNGVSHNTSSNNTTACHGTTHLHTHTHNEDGDNCHNNNNNNNNNSKHRNIINNSNADKSSIIHSQHNKYDNEIQLSPPRKRLIMDQGTQLM